LIQGSPTIIDLLFLASKPAASQMFHQRGITLARKLGESFVQNSGSSRAQKIARMSTVYDFQAKTLQGDEVSMDKYKGRVIVAVNTATL